MTIDWIRKAAEEIHDRMPEIDAEAGQAGAASQDIDVDRETFVGLVEEIIQRHYAGSKAPADFLSHFNSGWGNAG